MGSAVCKRAALALGAAVGLLILGMVVPAFAGTTIYTQENPTSGSSVGVNNPTISVVAVDPFGLYSSITMKVDGTALKATYSYATGTAKAQTFNLSNGTHTAYVSTLNYAGQRNSYSWTFRVAVPPKVTSPTPMNDAVVGTQRPDVAATVMAAPGASVVSADMWLDGQPVTSTYDPASRRLSWVKDRDLADEERHQARVRVVDSGGLQAELTWSFIVQQYADMVQPACTSCHPDMPLAHDTTSPETCFTCHNAPDYDGTGETSPIGDCVDCHYWVHPSDRLLAYECESCHAQQWSARIDNHDAEPADYHQTTTSMAGCSCHSKALSREHARRTDDLGSALTCETCHQSADAAVAAAIVSGNTACEACHGAVAHTAVHESTLEAGCSDCHASNLVTEHDEKGYECSTCHVSTDPTVQAAITAGDTSCQACHGVADHTAVHESTVDPDCSGCHQANLVTEHEARAVTCAACHDSIDPAVQDAISAGNKSCVACHGAVDHQTVHESTISVDCAECHQANLVSEHESRSLDCAACHASSDPAVTAAIAAGIKDCNACHGNTDHSMLHDSTLASDCASCHQGNLVVEHESRGFGCAACHASTDPAVNNAIATHDKSCQACHTLADGHGQYQESQHTSTIGSQTLTGTYANTAYGNASYSVACTACHQTVLGAEHSRTTSSSSAAGCGACHPSPRNSFATWDTGCVQGGCHTATSPAEQHKDMRAAHAYAAADLTDCFPCHQGIVGQDVAELHVREKGNQTGCLYCHNSNASLPTTVECRVCHSDFTPDNHW